MLTGYSEPPHWKRLAVAPFDLQAQVLALIDREAERAQRGEPARIIAKMNSLVDPAIDPRALRAPARRAWTSSCWCAASAACAPGVPGADASASA